MFDEAAFSTKRSRNKKFPSLELSMLPPLNPYIAGAALSGERGFFGRNNIIRKVKQILRHPTDNAIIDGYSLAIP